MRGSMLLARSGAREAGRWVSNTEDGKVAAAHREVCSSGSSQRLEERANRGDVEGSGTQAGMGIV